MKVELTKAAIEGWKRDGAQGVEMRKYIFAHEWETLCDLALKGLESARPEALPIPTSERLPEYQQNVLLWLVTVDPKNSGWVLGQRSSHEEGKFWDGERYRPMQWITHWKPLPAAPSVPSPLARK